MAKGFLGIAMKAMKDADRASKAAQRDRERQAAAEARAAKQRETNLKRAKIANEKDRIAYEKSQKAAHIASQISEVERRNSQIDSVFEDLENLLQATIGVDDYVDLEALRRTEITHPFDRPELEVPLTPPLQPIFPPEPKFVEPPKTTGLFGRKRKTEEARKKAQDAYETAKSEWQKSVAKLKANHTVAIEAYEKAEANRVEELGNERARHQSELLKFNQELEQFISNLSFGDATAVQEYISLVVQNSVYPDHLQISHDFTFEPEVAELKMKVSISPPDDFPSVKNFKYVKSSDEIVEVALSKADTKALYSRVVHQVAIRTLHEVFEADRRGLIISIALEVGTTANDPATGKNGFIPFLGVAAQREAFMEFDLSQLVPLATLKHLGASISKDPFNLIAADIGGVRKT